jgi:chromosome segregation ATPase
MTMASGDVADQKPLTRAPPEEFERLEKAARRLTEELAGYRARARMAETRAVELEQALKDVSTGALDPLSLRDRIRKLEQENKELRRRMLHAQDRIRKLVARFDFLREEM